MTLMLSVHPSRQQDIVTEQVMRFSPTVAARHYRDAFGNICTRLVSPAGLLEVRNDFVAGCRTTSRPMPGNGMTCPADVAIDPVWSAQRFTVVTDDILQEAESPVAQAA